MDNAALVNADGDPDEEGLIGEGAAGFEFLVQFWVESCERFGDVGVEDEGENGEEGIEGCIADKEPVLGKDSRSVFVAIVGEGKHTR